jgi:hypothetical protein
MSDNEIDPKVIAEFSSNDGDPIDERGAAIHARAEHHLDELGVTPSEQAYLAAVETVADSIAPAAPRDRLERHLESAEALGNLARARLADDASADDYLAEIRSIEETHHLYYGADWELS